MSDSFCCHSTKSKIFTFALLILALLISGCGSSGTKSDKSTFTIAVQSDAVRLDPPAISDIPSTNIIADKLYETLVERRPDGTIVPQLATEWTQVDPTTWEFTLRKGVKFQDGTDFNAQAVKITIDRILDKSNSFPRRNLISMIKEVQVIDDHKVRIITEFPFSALLIHLSHSGVSMISPKAISENDAKPLAQNPCGTGPFKLVKWTKGQEIVMERFDGYWGEKPKIAKAIFKVVPEDATRLAMVKTGEAQAAEDVPISEASRISQDKDLELIRTPGYGVEYLAFNSQKEPFTDKRVRQALALSLNLDAIASGVYQNPGRRHTSTMTDGMLGYHSTLPPFVQNKEAAKKLLAEAGLPDGFTFTLLTNDNKTRVKLAEVIQAQLKEVGITVNLKVVERGVFIKDHLSGDYTAIISGWSNPTGDGDFSQFPMHGQAGIETGENAGRYSNPRIEQLLQDSRREMDPAKRAEDFKEIQEIVREDAPVVVTRSYEFLAVSRKNVKNFSYNRANNCDLRNVVIE